MIENLIFGFENIICDIDYAKTAAQLQQLGIESANTISDPTSRNEIFKNFELGKYSVNQFKDVFNAFAHTNLNIGEIYKILHTHILPPDNETLELLNDIGAFFKTILIWNVNPLTMLWADSFEFSSQNYPISLYFSRMYCSYQCAYLLPDWHYFDFITTFADIKPEDSVVIDSNLEVLKSADCMGFSVFRPDSRKTLNNYLRNLIELREDD